MIASCADDGSDKSTSTAPSPPAPPVPVAATATAPAAAAGNVLLLTSATGMTWPRTDVTARFVHEDGVGACEDNVTLHP